MRAVLHALAAVALVLPAGCGTTPAAPFRAEGLARQISDDAVAFNEAYSRAVSGQLLLNILRARDRQPRFYLSMSGIQDAPGVRYTENVGIGGAPLGEGGSPWGFGNFGFERETQSRPSYAVQPLSAETLTRTVFLPTPSNVFEHYWQSGWSRDLLLFLMVEKITRVEHQGAGEPRLTEFINDATQLRDDCRGETQSRGCAFVVEARRLLGDIAQRTPMRARPGAAEVCGLVEAFDAPSPVMRARDGKDCEPRFVVGSTSYVLSLRSFDDMIFYVGELMRPSTTEGAETDAIDARLTVFAAGLRSDRGVPLFRILPANEAARAAPRDPHLHFAASVNYGGQRYFAGPPVGRSCVSVGEGMCADDPAAGDRSSSVLSLLAELLALNQSPDAIRAPNRLIVD